MEEETIKGFKLESFRIPPGVEKLYSDCLPLEDVGKSFGLSVYVYTLPLRE